MRWRGRRESENVEDQRGQESGGGFGFPSSGNRGYDPFSGRRPGRGGGIGIVGLIILVVIMLMLGIDPRVLLQGFEGNSPQQSPSGYQQTQRPSLSPQVSDELKQFVAVTLADTEDVWNKVFQEKGRQYEEPRLVLFSGYVRSACGMAQSAMGPFYCPMDRKVYIDLSFYNELKTRFKAPGDFAQAYVIAHEVGHHVQTLLGISAKVQNAKQRVSQTEANQIQVKMELQADCFAGLWAHHAERNKKILEQGDIEEALNAASAIGDDNIQKQTRGHVVPDSFTHGSSAQRVRWFKIGFDTGNMAACDTFSTPQL